MRFASDTGGTFTDLVVEDDDGAITMYKSATVPGDPVQGVLSALQLAADERGLSLSAMLARADMFVHGTTHAINAIVTGAVARTALLVTEGHRDMLVFREGGRPEPFNHKVPYPKPYVPRSLTFEIPERLIYNGEVRKPLNEAAVVEILRTLANKNIEAVAVCLLWATVNPIHERRVGELIKQHLPGVPYTLAHEINPTLREFRRASSAAIDASLKPLMAKYLGGLTDRMRSAGFAGDIMILTSGGGMVDAEEVAHAPIKVINSGPSMAPIAGQYYAAMDGQERNVIVADTGGTTYDISLIRDGVVPMTRELWVGKALLGEIVGYPSVDVKSVGAGGGSIAYVDAGGLLRVGPQSAGAAPGPVCYRRGGASPTVTDAAVCLGYIDPDFFLGGAISLDLPAARAAIHEHIAKPLGLSIDEACWRIMELATENMVQAIADITVAQGIDPTKATLIGGGGAAGLNSTFIARRLGCRKLIIPETGAALSAAGATMSQIVSEYAASIFATTERVDLDRLARTIAGLKEKCVAFARRPSTEKLEYAISFVAEARYEGQVWDIDVPFDADAIAPTGGMEKFRSDFDAMHEQIFSVRDEDSHVEIIGMRATVRCDVPRRSAFRLASNAARIEPPPPREVYFHGYGRISAAVHRMETLESDVERGGPAILESPFTTIVVDPDARFLRSAAGSVIIRATGD